MRICNILLNIYLNVCLVFATNSGSIYKVVTCLSEMSPKSNDVYATLSECAILSNFHNREVFSFHHTTSVCKEYTADANVGTVCSSPNGDQYYKLQNDCQLPVPSNYTLEYPYNGNKELARYRCKALTDQPPVDHCPVVKCGSQPDMSTPPASCSVKDRFNSRLKEYEGGVTCTIQGITCQRWDTNFPHTVNHYSGRSDLGNRCQIFGEVRPWCYTVDPDDRWDFCPFADLNCGDPPSVQLPSTMTGARIEVEWPYRQQHELVWYRCASYETANPVANCPIASCNGDLTWSKANVSCSVKDCYDATSLTYHGRVSCTEAGITCQRWDTDVPHSHSVLSGRSDLENWCQIGDEDKPWCYTTNPNFRWQYCPVEECPSDCQLLPVPSDYTLEHPYNGNKGLARYRCKAITDQPPVDHCPVVKCGSQPNMSIPLASCSVKDRFNSSLKEFEGGVTCTIKGTTCQRWDTNFPQTVNHYSGRSDLGNRCQIYGEIRPWCYTVDPDDRWDFCPFADLNCGDPPPVQLPSTMTGARIEVEWPYSQQYELAWYWCASFVTTDPMANCPVATCNADLTWSTANVSCSVKDCYNATSRTYDGRVTCTEAGITCQRWDTDIPHSHSEFSGRSDLENWCQMAGDYRPWCYTTNPNFRRQYCSVERCH